MITNICLKSGIESQFFSKIATSSFDPSRSHISMITCFILGSFEVTNFGSIRILETCNLLLEVLRCSFLIS